MRSLTVALASVAFVFASCTDPSPPDEAFTRPPVGVLDTGEHKVILHSSPEGPLYTLEDAGGNLVAREMTREEFAKAFPDLREEIGSLWAGNERGETLAPDDPSRPVYEDLLRPTEQDLR